MSILLKDYMGVCIKHTQLIWIRLAPLKRVRPRTTQLGQMGLFQHHHTILSASVCMLFLASSQQTTGLNLQYLNLNVSGSAPNQSCYQLSAGGLLELVLRPNLLILTPGNLGTPPKARDELAENSRDFALSESALLRKLYTILFCLLGGFGLP
jgi:hypothetical protein